MYTKFPSLAEKVHELSDTALCSAVACCDCLNLDPSLFALCTECPCADACVDTAQASGILLEELSVRTHKQLCKTPESMQR